MKFYGHANLQQNELQNAALSTVTAFPPDAKVGQVAFVNKRVYICVQVDPAPPIWVPLTQEITAHKHTQETSALTWTVTHNLNTTAVSVQAFGTDNRVLIPDEIDAVSNNVVSISFNTPLSGRATVLSGHETGEAKPTYALTYYQNTASTTWTIVHNLGYNPILRVFIGLNEVQPNTIAHPDTNTTVITFSTAQVGYARLI
jgi:hypothetical protein